MASTLDLARLSAHVYSWNHEQGKVPSGSVGEGEWVCVRRFGPDGTEVAAGQSIGPGFAAALYQEAQRGEFAFAIRGTDDLLDASVDDVLIAARFNADQLHQAKAALSLVRAAHRGTPLYLTGHSLGGGLAVLLAAENPDLPTVTFNAPVMNALAMTPADLLRPGFGSAIRALVSIPWWRGFPSPFGLVAGVLAQEPVVVWQRRSDERILHVRALGDIVSMPPPPEFRSNPGLRLTLLVPPWICPAFPRIDRLTSGDGTFCPHFIRNLIAAIRDAPPNPLLHDDLRWLDFLGSPLRQAP